MHCSLPFFLLLLMALLYLRMRRVFPLHVLLELVLVLAKLVTVFRMGSAVQRLPMSWNHQMRDSNGQGSTLVG